MKLATHDLETLAAVALTAAIEAGELIATTRPTHIEHKASGDSVASQVVTEIDRGSEAIIIGHLDATLTQFDLGLLTEERADDGGRLERDHFWCIDPLDGTLPFIEGRAGYAVSIALVARDGTPLIGVTYDPVSATTVHAVAAGGAFRNGEPWVPQRYGRSDRLTVFADRSFTAHARMEAVAKQLGMSGVDLRIGAGAVANALGVLDQSPACYVKFPKGAGGGSVWDFAATACVFGELGAVATDISGQPLDLNRSGSTFMHHRGVLFATDTAIAQQIQA